MSCRFQQDPFDAYVERSKSQTRKEPQMSNALLLHDLADAIMRQRLQEAAQQALLAQLPAAQRPSWLDHLAAHIRQSVAGGLRGLAVRRDRSPDCQPVLAGAASSSSR
jgi:hypothetical protein